MTEFSYPWPGTTVGDAGPYTADQWMAVWKTISTFNTGEIVRDRNYGNALGVVSYTTNEITVRSGAAFFDGSYYVNDADTPFLVASGPRTDRIILQKDWATQTIRIVIEEDIGAITNNPGILVEGILAKYDINGSGAFSNLDTSFSRQIHLNTFIDEPQIDDDAVIARIIRDDAVHTRHVRDFNPIFPTFYGVGGDELGVQGLRMVYRRNNSAGLGTDWELPGGLANILIDSRVSIQVGVDSITVPNSVSNTNGYYPIPQPYASVSPGVSTEGQFMIFGQIYAQEGTTLFYLNAPPFLRIINNASSVLNAGTEFFVEIVKGDPTLLDPPNDYPPIYQPQPADTTYWFKWATIGYIDGDNQLP